MILIQDDVDQAKELDLFICINQLSIELVYVPLELSVEVRFDDCLVVAFEGRCRHDDCNDFPLGFFIVLKLIFVCLVEKL